MDTDDDVPPSIAAAGPAFHQAFLALRRQYALQLPQKLQEAREMLMQCQADPQAAEPLERLGRLMHTMAGTAPTIGFEAQGAHALRVEQRAHALLLQPHRTAADLQPLDDLLRELAVLGARRSRL